MTIEEKLQNFYDVSMENAREESADELEKCRKALDQIFREHQETVMRQNELQIQTETEENRRINNIEISKEQLKMKRQLSKQEYELTDQLFQEVEEKLLAFKSGQGYRKWMKKQLEQAESYAPEEEVKIYLDPSDENLAEELFRSVRNSRMEFCISQEEFLGGLQAVIPSRNILIDRSLRKLLDETRENFRLREEL